jgi:hypothetical protein
MHHVPQSRFRTALYAAVVAAVAGGGGLSWWLAHRSVVPEGFALANDG